MNAPTLVSACRQPHQSPMPSVAAPSAAAASAHFPQPRPMGDLALCVLVARAWAVPRARLFTDSQLAAWRIDEDTAYGAAVIVSELVTNSVTHSHSADVSIRLIRSGSHVRIEVSDSGVWQGPSPLRNSDLAEGGRGLALVAMLSESCGVRHDTFGTRVWALLSRHAGAC